MINKKIRLLKFFRQKRKYNRMCDRKSFLAKRGDLFPILKDISQEAGKVDGHYFLQDIYVAKKIIALRPNLHYDIGSRIDGFISHLLAADINISSIDIRPLPYEIENLTFTKGDATRLEEIKDKTISSISSLHAIEHFGLGRYGDDICPNACFDAMKTIQRVLKKGGVLYFAVPIGNVEKCCFNAHRIFLPSTVVKCFNELELLEFSYVENMKINSFTENIDIDEIDQVVGKYCCGIFIFKREN